MTSKETNIVLVVVAIILAALFWFLGYKPINNDVILIKNEINELNTELSLLSTEYVKKDVYLEEIEEMQSYIDLVDESFPAFTTQEMIIHTLLQTEEEVETLTIPSYTMSTSVNILSDGEYKDEATNEIKYKENLLETEVTLDIDTSYEDMKKLLAYIHNYKSKLSIKGLTMTSDLVQNIVSSSFTLSFYALVSEDRPFIPEDYFGPFKPKDDAIFKPYDSYGASFDSGIAEGQVADEADDFLLNLSSIYADRSTIIMYKKDDTAGTTYLYTDSDQLEPMEIVFDKVGESYTYKYKTSSASYPIGYGAGIAFVPGNFIDLGVYSESRAELDDFSGVNVSIINNTDLPVKIDVVSDDVESPRFNIVSQTGQVSESRKAN